MFQKSFQIDSRYILVARVDQICVLFFGTAGTNLQNNVLMQILFYGDEKFPDELDKNVLLLTLQFIHKAGRLNQIRTSLYATQTQPDSFRGLDSKEMVKIFTEKLSEVFSFFIPNKTVKFNDKDQPRITPQLKAAIKRKYRIYSKFVQSGRKQEDWNRVKNVKSETSRLIHPP